MAIAKKEEFSLRSNTIAKYAKALSHPARVSIIQLLAKKRSCFCGNIVEELPLSQSTVSQHLQELKNAGLITGEIEGAKVCYCINEKEWKIAARYIAEFFGVDITICC